VPKTSLGYRALTTLADRLLPLAGGLSDKLRVGDAGRRAAVARWTEWAAAHRDPARPLLWCHAPSVGEGLQAEAVLRILRDRRPEWQIGYSYFSPSAVRLGARQPVDRADYLPYDTPANVAAMLDALRPTALVFTKLDLWPELAAAARSRAVRVGMIAGTVSPASGRLRPAARALTRPGYAALELVGAVAEPDAARLRTLGTPPAAVRITGDPRFDSALRVVESVGPDEPLRRHTVGAPTLVAGSTWEPDEEVLLHAFVRVRDRIPEARLILVPHEPTADHLGRLDVRAGRLGLTPVRLSVATDPGPLLVVDRVGLLATLYVGAALAYVGGGFGRAGLHSVLEPAAAAVPVIVGPRWQSSREAGLLLAAGAAEALPAGGAASPELARVWSDWLVDAAARSERGRRARKIATEGRGGAERNAALIEELMDGARVGPGSDRQRPTTTPS
jgi:3-deoxy-D-manno-octulosonic-acid transferase